MTDGQTNRISSGEWHPKRMASSVKINYIYYSCDPYNTCTSELRLWNQNKKQHRILQNNFIENLEAFVIYLVQDHLNLYTYENKQHHWVYLTKEISKDKEFLRPKSLQHLTMFHNNNKKKILDLPSYLEISRSNKLNKTLIFKIHVRMCIL